MQTVTTNYRGYKIHMRLHKPGRWGIGLVYVSIDDGYQTTASNLQVAMAYACNAIAYGIDGDGNWPAGLPLVVRPALRRPSQPFVLDGRIREYLDAKKEDY